MDKLPNVAPSRQSLTDCSMSTERTKLHATKCAKILLGCYRSGDANDPEIYVRSVIAVLSAYPADVMDRVVDPVTGLPSRLQWLPSVAEIRKACEELYGPMRRAAEWDAGAKRQLEEREQFEAARTSRMTYADLKAKYPEAWVAEQPQMTAEQRRQQLEQANADSEWWILRRYRALGKEPVTTKWGNRELAISPELLAVIDRQVGQR